MILVLEVIHLHSNENASYFCRFLDFHIDPAQDDHVTQSLAEGGRLVPALFFWLFCQGTRPDFEYAWSGLVLVTAPRASEKAWWHRWACSMPSNSTGPGVVPVMVPTSVPTLLLSVPAPSLGPWCPSPDFYRDEKSTERELTENFCGSLEQSLGGS